MKGDDIVENRYYIYLFKIKKTGKIIYVGSTWRIGNRINSHRRSMREKDRAQPIHKYLNAKHLQLFKDVEIDIVDTVIGKKAAMKLESEYYHKYKLSSVNMWDANKRSKDNSPVRQPLMTKDHKRYFDSQRDAAEKLGVSRYFVNKMTKSGELVKVSVKNKYTNITTGENYISAYQLMQDLNIDVKFINELNEKGSIVINGMTIRKV